MPGMNRRWAISSLKMMTSWLTQGKAVAVFNLLKGLRGSQTELTVYYSSIGRMLGGQGRSNYCAANAALDSLG